MRCSAFVFHRNPLAFFLPGWMRTLLQHRRFQGPLGARRGSPLLLETHFHATRFVNSLAVQRPSPDSPTIFFCLPRSGPVSLLGQRAGKCLLSSSSSRCTLLGEISWFCGSIKRSHLPPSITCRSRRILSPWCVPLPSVISPTRTTDHHRFTRTICVMRISNITQPFFCPVLLPRVDVICAQRSFQFFNIHLSVFSSMLTETITEVIPEKSKSVSVMKTN